MLAWLTELAASGVFKLFGDNIITPILNIWAKSKDVDLAKFTAAAQGTGALAGAVLAANQKFAETKASYALSILNWWPFRLLLFVLLAGTIAHFTAIMIDSTCWKTAARPLGGCGWGIPEVPPKYADIEHSLLLFFVIAKPADTLISGAIAALMKYLQK